MKYFFYRVIGILYCITCTVQAEEGVIKDAEFVIEKERQNQLAIEDKLLAKAPVMTYMPDLMSTMPQSVIETDIPQFPIIPYQDDYVYRKILMNERVYRNYIKGGGSLFPWSKSLKPYGVLFLNSKLHPDHAYGIQILYTPMRNIDYAIPFVAQVYGKLLTTSCILKGNALYQYDTYLMNNKKFKIDNKKIQKTTLHHHQVSIMCTDYEENNIRYRAAIHCHFLRYGYTKLKEGVCNVHLNIRCALQDWITCKVKNNIYFTRYQDNKNIRWRNLGCISPMLIATFSRLYLKIGGWLVYHNNNSTKIVNNNFYANSIYLGPKIKMEGIFKNINLYAAGCYRTMQPLFLHNLCNENVLLTEDIEIKHHQLSQIGGGIKMTLFTHLIANGGISRKWKYNAYRFLRIPGDHVAFKVKYCDNETTVSTTNVFGILNYKNSTNFINLCLRGDYYWHRQQIKIPWWYDDPESKISVQGVCKLLKNLLLKSTFCWLHGLKSQDRYGQTIGLNDIIDLGVGLDYLWNSKCTVFLSANNVFNRDNKYYIDYPAKQFYLLGGLTYSW